MTPAPTDRDPPQPGAQTGGRARLTDEMPPPRTRPRSASMPAFMWLILGALVVALFVLLMAGLSPYA